MLLKQQGEWLSYHTRSSPSSLAVSSSMVRCCEIRSFRRPSHSHDIHTPFLNILTVLRDGSTRKAHNWALTWNHSEPPVCACMLLCSLGKADH